MAYDLEHAQRAQRMPEQLTRELPTGPLHTSATQSPKAVPGVDARAALNQRPYHVRVLCDSPRKLASEVLRLDSVDAVNVDPDGAIVVLSRNVVDLQVELPRIAQAQKIRLKRVEPLDDSLESVFGYLVEG